MPFQEEILLCLICPVKYDKNQFWNKTRKKANEYDFRSCDYYKMILDTATRVQILDLTDCISHSTNTLGKGMNPNILPPAMGK